jgi:hypothetical protein
MSLTVEDLVRCPLTLRSAPNVACLPALALPRLSFPGGHCVRLGLGHDRDAPDDCGRQGS